MDVERALYGDHSGRLPTLAEFRKWQDEKREARAARFADQPAGRQWLCDVPGPDGMRVYIVRRRFTADDGTPAYPGEIILPDLGFWAERPLRMLFFNDGYLEPLTKDTLAWQCPHVRYWETPESFAEHDCADLPGMRPVNHRPPVPRYPADRERWARTWRRVKGRVDLGDKPADIEGWLAKTHPNERASQETLKRIIRAGHAGLLG